LHPIPLKSAVSYPRRCGLFQTAKKSGVAEDMRISKE
jgi:hypothetical protein